MKTIYRLQAYHGYKYRTIWEGSNLGRAIITMNKPYWRLYSLKLLKVTEIIIDLRKKRTQR